MVLFGAGSNLSIDHMSCYNGKESGDLGDKRSLFHFDRKRHLLPNRDPLSGVD